MVASAEWPLPSESRRVRRLFYLADGLFIGGFLAFLFIEVFGPFLVDIETGAFRLHLPAISGFLLLVFFFFILRGTVFLKITRRTSREQPPEQQDWEVTRQWHWTATVALFIGGLLLTGSVALWGWWRVVYLQTAALLMLGVIMSGLLLKLYLFHRMGLRII